ncbi:hypothetical protein D3C79_603890 [compost metagenome]
MHGVGLEPGSAQQLAKAVVVQHQSVLLCQLPVKGRTIGKQGLAGHGHQQHLGTAALYRLYHGGEIGLELPLPAAVQYVIPPLQQDDQGGPVLGQQAGQTGPPGTAQLPRDPAIDDGVTAQARQYAGVALGRIDPAPLGQAVSKCQYGLPRRQGSEPWLPAGGQQQADQPRHATPHQTLLVHPGPLLDIFVTT